MYLSLYIERGRREGPRRDPLGRTPPPSPRRQAPPGTPPPPAADPAADPAAAAHCSTPLQHPLAEPLCSTSPKAWQTIGSRYNDAARAARARAARGGQAWGEALTALIAQLPPLPYDDGGKIGDRLVSKEK